MKELFEKWLVEQFGEHIRKQFELWHEEDGYSDSDINFMWLGFNAGIRLADNL